MSRYALIAKRGLVLAAFAATCGLAAGVPANAEMGPGIRTIDYASGTLSGFVGTIDSDHHWIELRTEGKVYAVDCNDATMYLDGEKMSFRRATRDLPAHSRISVVIDSHSRGHKVKASVVRLWAGGGRDHRDGDHRDRDH